VFQRSLQQSNTRSYSKAAPGRFRLRHAGDSTGPAFWRYPSGQGKPHRSHLALSVIRRSDVPLRPACQGRQNRGLGLDPAQGDGAPAKEYHSGRYAAAAPSDRLEWNGAARFGLRAAPSKPRLVGPAGTLQNAPAMPKNFVVAVLRHADFHRVAAEASDMVSDLSSSCPQVYAPCALIFVDNFGLVLIPHHLTHRKPPGMPRETAGCSRNQRLGCR